MMIKTLTMIERVNVRITQDLLIEVVRNDLNAFQPTVDSGKYNGAFASQVTLMPSCSNDYRNSRPRILV